VAGSRFGAPQESSYCYFELGVPIFLCLANRKVDTKALMFATLVTRQKCRTYPGNEKNGRTADG
jgi:hypothetical protein